MSLKVIGVGSVIECSTHASAPSKPPPISKWLILPLL